MKRYMISIPDERNAFFIELIKSLGFAFKEDTTTTLEDSQVQAWQIDIVEKRIKNTTEDSLKDWDDVKDQFRLD